MCSGEKFLAPMRAAGIPRACGAPVEERPREGFGPFAASNKLAMEYQRQFPDFYIPGIQADPRFPKESCREIEKHYALGVRWIGELAAYVLGYKDEYDSPGAFQIYDLAQRLGMPINLHVGDLGQVAQACEAFPRLPFILAHPRADKNSIMDRAKMAARYPNCYLDLSGIGITRWGMVRYCCDTAGAEKFLFGTDYPVSTPESFTVCVLSEPLSDRERALIFAGNFKRLTGLK
jgi:predicted TIM-barrel fold metal-dependent hydrolase